MTNVERQLGLHDMSGPRIITNTTDSVIGVGLQDHTIVQVIDEHENQEFGVLPHRHVTDAPHVKKPHTIITGNDEPNREGIPLNTAPNAYITDVQNEFTPVAWTRQADQYAKHTDADEHEAVVMAIAEHIDTVGAGQPARISEITGWCEEFVQELLTGLLLSNQTLYRRQYNKHCELTGIDNTENTGTGDDGDNDTGVHEWE